MSQLYCGDCQNYLMGSDGQCHDCGCGWKQPVETYEKENTELETEVARLQKENDELRLMINGSVLQIQAMQLQINAMKIGQKVLDGSIQAQSISDSEWREKYMREVEGLNNEGDPIGGDPPSGLRNSVEYLKSENAAQAKLISDLKASLQECMDEAAEWLNECRGIEPEQLTNHAWYSRAKALLEPTKDE